MYIINRDPFRSIRRDGNSSNASSPACRDRERTKKTAWVTSTMTSPSGRFVGQLRLMPWSTARIGGHGWQRRHPSRQSRCGHLFGLGLKEMLADEITTDLRSTRDLAVTLAQQMKRPMTLKLVSKGVQYGLITGNPDGSVDTSKVQGVDADLRVKPFFAEGNTISLREFVVGALHNEMGLEASADPDLLVASAGGAWSLRRAWCWTDPKTKSARLLRLMRTMERDRSRDRGSSGVLLAQLFQARHGEPNSVADHGRRVFQQLGCSSCHVADMTINHDRRVADLETVCDPARESSTACLRQLRRSFAKWTTVQVYRT